MPEMNDVDVAEAVSELDRVLRAEVSRDWQVAAGSLEWTCRETAAHIAHDLYAYAGQLTARREGSYLPCDLHVRDAASIEDVLQIVNTGADLLGQAIRSADSTSRAWHWGPTDTSGFAAMGVAEVLLHTFDITSGLGVAWLPPEGLSARVLGRLFPDAPEGDPLAVLLWCTGRGELEGRDRRTSWTWRAAI